MIDYYKGFNNSIGTFGGVLQYINGEKKRIIYGCMIQVLNFFFSLVDSSSRVVQMKTNLKKCKEELLQKRTDLLNLWYKSQQYKEMLSILETM